MTSPTPSPSSRPRASLRTSPADFLVEELPAYAAQGEGLHLFVTFRKTGLDTPVAVRRIADALGLDPREAGFAGMKDRHAITTQTASFFFPAERDPEEATALVVEGVEILAARRHPHKLKTGHLAGNRFTIVLRDLDPARTPEILAALDEVKVQGVPNAFGGQRFGREGDNADRGRKMLLGEIRPPRNKKQQRFLFSAFQSRMFNEVLAAREADGSWCRILPGDVAQKHDSGGLFTVPLEGPELDDAVARSHAGQISPTGPMFGSKMRRAEGPVGELEAGVLAAALPDPSVLDAHQRLGRGTRRPLRIWVDELSYDLDDAARCLTVRFVLPKGAYATTVLSKTCELHDQSRNAVEPGGGQW